MTPIRHNHADADPVLDAARDCVLAVGVRRTTLTDVARRAGVSRMTLYRRWPDVRTLVGDLMTREWISVAAGAMPPADDDLPERARIVEGLVAGVAAFRSHPLFRKILDVDPSCSCRTSSTGGAPARTPCSDCSSRHWKKGTRTVPYAAPTPRCRPGRSCSSSSPSRSRCAP